MPFKVSSKVFYAYSKTKLTLYTLYTYTVHFIHVHYAYTVFYANFLILLYCQKENWSIWQMLYLSGIGFKGQSGVWMLWSDLNSLYRHFKLRLVLLVLPDSSLNRQLVDVLWQFWQSALKAGVLFSYPRRKDQGCLELSSKGQPPLDV